MRWLKWEKIIMKAFTISTLLILLCFGCRSSNTQALESAINRYYKAWQADDGDAIRSLVVPTMRDDVDLSKMIKDNKENPILSWRIVNIEPDQPVTNDGKSFKTAKVAMEVKVLFKGENEPRVPSDQRD
jgi:hypothetical protein